MDRHKYDTPLNEHLVGASPICAFRFGLDKLFLIEIPDFENVGYIQGWILLVGCKPYYVSIAGGSEGLNSYIANAYAQYLVDCNEFDDIEPIMGEDDLYVLDDDTSIAFNEAFDDAMLDAGYQMRDDGGWVLKKPSKKKRAKK
jgi:hypothetical protein